MLRTNGVIKWPTPHFLHCWCGNLSHNFLWWHRQMTTGVGFTPHYDPLFFTFIFVNHCTPPHCRQPVAAPRRIVAAALSPLPLPTALQTCQVGPWRDGELIECDSGATTTSQPQRQAESNANMPTVEFSWITCRCPLLLINVVLEWPHTLDVATKAFLKVSDTYIKIFHFSHRLENRCVLRHISSMKIQSWAVLGSQDCRQK